MESLDRSGFRVVSVSDAVALLHDRANLETQRVVAVSFDDGYRNVYERAFPVLQQFGFSATVYLITNYCGRRNDWPGHVSPVGPLELATWSDISEMTDAGIEMGAHTLNHPDLTGISQDVARAEIVGSKEAIEDKTGAVVRSFAYPYGRFGAAARSIASEHFENTVTTRLALASRPVDLHSIGRLDMYYFQRPDLASVLGAGYLKPMLATRRWMRGLKGVLSR
jgi:peptidoglycan/xylan/chitin deacetylase (PgdA/CDA1 family)